jgi:hypothetical protein
VLKRRIIVDSNATSAGGIDDEDRDGCGDGAPHRRVVGMSPATALFLRVRCEMSSSSETNEDMDMDEDEAAAYEDGKNFVCLQLKVERVPHRVRCASSPHKLFIVFESVSGSVTSHDDDGTMGDEDNDGDK